MRDRRRPSSSLWIALFLIAGLALGLAAGLLAADTPCTITCSVVYPAQAKAGSWIDITYSGSSSGDCGGVYVQWWSGVPGEGPFTWPTTSVQYQNPGTYHWKWRFYSSSTGAECIKEGDITILACTVECTASVTPNKGTSVQGNASGTLQNCYYSYLEYKWDWGDGNVDNFSQSNTHVTHYYSKPGAFKWTMTARPIYTYNADCVKSGNINIGCLGIGELSFCADSVQQSGDTYTLSGNVVVNGCLHLDGTVTVRRDPGANTGTVSFPSAAWVSLAKGPQTVLFGPLSLAMDGDARTLTVPSENPPRYGGDTLGGVMQYVAGSTSTFDSIMGVMTMDPLLYIGKQGQALASVRAQILYSGQRQLLGAEVVDSNLTPGIIVWSVDLGYTYFGDLLHGTVTVKFPDLDYLTLDAQLALDPARGNCINRFEAVAAVNEDQALGQTPFLIWGNTLDLGDICSPEQLAILLGTVQLHPEPQPNDYFVLTNLVLDYQRPSNFGFASVGTNQLIGIPYGNATDRTYGEISLKPATIKTYNDAFGFTTKFDSADLLGRLSATYQASDRKIAGKWAAVLNLKKVSCDQSDPQCKVLRTIVGSLVSLPCLTPSAVYDLEGQRGQGSSWYGVMAGKMTIGPLTIPTLITIQGSDRLLNWVMGKLDLDPAKTSGGAGPVAAERSVTLPAPRDQVCFAVVGNTTLPAIYLRNPAGQTITPASVGSFPGISYAFSNEDLTALFRVDTAAAGRWTLGVDNLGASDVSFQVLAEYLDPVVQFTEVTQTATSVTMSADVTPAEAGTTMDFYYSRSDDGEIDGIIATGLPADSGGAGAVWDTTGLPSGTYFLLAKAVDGEGIQVTTRYGSPVLVDNGGLEAPAGLCGTRDGATATLAWTPSGSPAVIGYQVLYTDHPEVAGYLYRQAVPGPDGATLAGLDPAAGYLFAVAAYDAAGQFSLESESYGLPPGDSRFDLNLDGQVNALDYLLLADFLAENAGPFGRCGRTGDFNGDGAVDLLDLAEMALDLAGRG